MCGMEHIIHIIRIIIVVGNQLFIDDYGCEFAADLLNYQLSWYSSTNAVR